MIFGKPATRTEYPPARAKSGGFSLIELMVVVAIAAILAAVAFSSYRTSVLKSHRTEAKTALLDLAGREERYYNANNNTYTLTQAGLGYGTAGNMTNVSVGSGYYQVSVTNVNAATTTTAATYLITATAVGQQTQDAACATFSVNNLGQQTATGTDPNPNVDCWQ
jgi:type IV pilus assembly protein PilE